MTLDIRIAIIIAAAALWNIAALLTVLHDKAAARRNGDIAREGARGSGISRGNTRRKTGNKTPERRVPEKRFLFFAATLGGAGVLIGFYGARHKTLHRRLLAGVWCLAAASYAVAAGAVYLAFRAG